MIIKVGICMVLGAAFFPAIAVNVTADKAGHSEYLTTYRDPYEQKHDQRVANVRKMNIEQHKRDSITHSLESKAKK